MCGDVGVLGELRSCHGDFLFLGVGGWSSLCKKEGEEGAQFAVLVQAQSRM